MSQFLLVYDRSLGKLVEAPREYSDAELEAAARARFAREREERAHPQIEVVLLGAKSLDDVKKTHARYFEGLGKRILQGLQSLPVPE